MRCDRSIDPVASLTPGEIRLLRRLGRADYSFGTVSASACRYLILASASKGRLDSVAELGLERCAASYLLRMACQPARSANELFVKRRLLQAWRPRLPAFSNLGVMLDEALAADVVALDDALRNERSDGGAGA